MLRRLTFILLIVPCCLLDIFIWVRKGEKFKLSTKLEEWTDED